MVLSKSVSGMIGRWKPSDLIGYLYRMFEVARTTRHEELRDAYNVRHGDQQTSSFGIMFALHAQGFMKISDTLEAFSAIDEYPENFRQAIFDALTLREMDSEMYVNGPWLREHTANSIDAAVHAPMYSKIADIARNWGLDDLAVTAAKYEAVILDEYGNAPDKAKAALEDARTWAGPDNWVLLRSAPRPRSNIARKGFPKRCRSSNVSRKVTLNHLRSKEHSHFERPG